MIAPEAQTLRPLWDLQPDSQLPSEVTDTATTITN